MSYTWLLCSPSVHILFETSGLGSLYLHIIYEVHSLCCNLCYSQTGGVHDQREARLPDGQRSHQHVRPDQQEHRLRRSVHPRGRHQSPIKAICARPLPASCTPQDVSSCLCPSLCLSSPPIGQTAICSWTNGRKDVFLFSHDGVILWEVQWFLEETWLHTARYDRIRRRDNPIICLNCCRKLLCSPNHSTQTGHQNVDWEDLRWNYYASYTTVVLNKLQHRKSRVNRCNYC